MKKALDKIKENRTGKNIPCALVILAYLVTETLIIGSGSEDKNAVFFGLSALRLLMIVGETFCFCIIIILLCRMRKDLRFVFPAQMFGVISVVSVSCVLIISLIDTEKTIYPVIVSRAAPLLLFLFVSGIILLYTSNSLAEKNFSKNIRKEILSVLACFIIACFFSHYDSISFEVNFEKAFVLWLIPAASAVIYSVTTLKGVPEKFRIAAWCFVLFSFSFAVIRTTQVIMGRTHTPASAYWGQLAQAFVQGRLYIEEPIGFHDLTFYNDRWYVPNPPMPALLLLPIALLRGPDVQINTTIYTAVLGAVNFVLMYLMLMLAVRNGLFFLDKKEILCLAAAMSFGSDHFWMATTGQMWFASQLVVVTFTTLALICQLHSKNPFLSGACIGAAVLSRPNVFPLFFCVLGIYFRQEKLKMNKKDLIKAFVWAVKCGIPVLVSVTLLLGYNRIRFDDWFDFGYTTINGARKIVEDVNRYGMFNIHFVPVNANVMFFMLPRIDLSGERFWFHPYVAGYSMFLMTPQLLYSFRSFKKNSWIIGSWISVLVIVGMLLMYHNTGSDQIGYRYILDAAAPLLLLIGQGMKGKAGIIFKTMTLFSVALQFVGIRWWYMV